MVVMFDYGSQPEYFSSYQQSIFHNLLDGISLVKVFKVVFLNEPIIWNNG